MASSGFSSPPGRRRGGAAESLYEAKKNEKRQLQPLRWGHSLSRVLQEARSSSVEDEIADWRAGASNEELKAVYGEGYIDIGSGTRHGDSLKNKDTEAPHSKSLSSVAHKRLTPLRTVGRTVLAIIHDQKRHQRISNGFDEYDIAGSALKTVEKQAMGGAFQTKLDAERSRLISSSLQSIPGADRLVYQGKQGHCTPGTPIVLGSTIALQAHHGGFLCFSQSAAGQNANCGAVGAQYNSLLCPWSADSRDSSASLLSGDSILLQTGRHEIMVASRVLRHKRSQEASAPTPHTVNFRGSNGEKARSLGRWIIQKVGEYSSTGGEICHLDTVIVRQQWVCLSSNSPHDAVLKAYVSGENKLGDSLSEEKHPQQGDKNGMVDSTCLWKIHLLELATGTQEEAESHQLEQSASKQLFRSQKRRIRQQQTVAEINESLAETCRKADRELAFIGDMRWKTLETILRRKYREQEARKWLERPKREETFPQERGGNGLIKNGGGGVKGSAYAAATAVAASATTTSSTTPSKTGISVDSDKALVPRDLDHSSLFQRDLEPLGTGNSRRKVLCRVESWRGRVELDAKLRRLASDFAGRGGSQAVLQRAWESQVHRFRPYQGFSSCQSSGFIRGSDGNSREQFDKYRIILRDLDRVLDMCHAPLVAS